jgi:hypothetical protein
MSKTVIISNIYNEEYYLPFWLEYHSKIFDHGIIIDYDSTDNSVEIVKKICPTWEVRRTKNIFDGKVLFETFLIEEECKQIELSLKNCYKIYLNTTEWMMLNKPLKELLDFNSKDICYLLNVYLPINNQENFYPKDTKEFIDGFNKKIVKVKNIRGYRFIFNRDCGHYLIGRHGTTVNTDYNVDVNKSSLERVGMCVIWCGFYPLNDKMWTRKLQIKNNMKKEIEYQPNIGRNSSFQHFYSLEQMKNEFIEYSSFTDVNDKSEDFEFAFEYMKSII